MVNKMINKSTLKKLKDEFLSKEENIIKNRILNNTSLMDISTDYLDNIDTIFDIEITTHGVVDQKNAGTCWSYAGLNILREEVIKNCNIDNIELSDSYIMFYDKLERFNTLIDRLKKYKEEGKNINDKYVIDLLKTGFDDGSTYSEFKEIIKKYGIVPKNCFSNSIASTDTNELNDILSRLLRLYYLDDDKEKYISYAYKVLGILIGLPKDKFDFEYKDKNDKYHIDKSITPNMFYDKYIKIDLDNYIEIYPYKDNKYKTNKLYKLEEGNLISGLKDVCILSLNYNRLEELIITQLKNNELVYFSTSTSSKYLNGLWIDLLSRYSNFFDIDLNMNNNDIIKTYGTVGEHSMVITGLNTNKMKWKVENSWGNKEGNNGYFVMEEKFLKNYIISAVINKKYLNKKELDILKTKPSLVSKWDYKFC